MSVQALRAELAVERLDEAVVRRLSGPGEVENDTLLISPEIEIAADELRALIDPDRRGISDGRADPFKGQHHILTPIAEPCIHGR